MQISIMKYSKSSGRTAPQSLKLSQWAIALSTAFLAVFAPIVKADCYSHDGILALDSKYYTGPELVSCGKGTNNCCLNGEKCGSNLLCTDPQGNLFRQYCADKNWIGCSSLCPEYNAAGISLTDCGDNIFCCPNGDTNCCSDGTGYFIDPGTGEVKAASEGSSTASATYWSVDSAALLASTTTSDYPSPTSSTVITSAVATSEATTPPIESSSSTSTALTGPGSTSVSNPPSSSESASSSSSNGLSVGAGAGIGVGCAAGVAGIAALVWLFFRERKKRRTLQEQISQSQAPHYNYPGGYQSPNHAGAHKEHYGQGQQDMVQSEHEVQQRQELEGRMRHEMS